MRILHIFMVKAAVGKCEVINIIEFSVERAIYFMQRAFNCSSDFRV